MFLTKRIVKWKIVGEDKDDQLLVKVYLVDMIWSENRDVLQLQNQKDNFGIQVVQFINFLLSLFLVKSDFINQVSIIKVEV